MATLIHRAVKRTGLSHSQDIEYDILHGDGLLWLAWNGEAIEAAAATSLVETDTHKVCILTACGGVRMPRWVRFMKTIEDYARSEGCASVRIYGRKGWQRVLEGYGTKHVILEKGLT